MENQTIAPSGTGKSNLEDQLTHSAEIMATYLLDPEMLSFDSQKKNYTFQEVIKLKTFESEVSVSDAFLKSHLPENTFC